MATQQEVIQNFMNSLDKQTKSWGEDALDAAVKAASKYFKGFQSGKTNLKDTFINDLKNAGSVEDFLRIYCGIDFTTDDNGAITGTDADGAKSKTATNIISESGSLNTSFKNNSFETNGLTVKLANKTFSNLSDSEKFIWQGLNTWWIKGALDLITESYGDEFNFEYKKKGKKNPFYTTELYVEFIDDASADKTSVNADYDEETGATTKITLTINMNYDCKQNFRPNYCSRYDTCCFNGKFALQPALSFVARLYHRRFSGTHRRHCRFFRRSFYRRTN